MASPLAESLWTTGALLGLVASAFGASATDTTLDELFGPRTVLAGAPSRGAAWAGSFDVVDSVPGPDGGWLERSSARSRRVVLMDGVALLEEWVGCDGPPTSAGLRLGARDPCLGRWVWLVGDVRDDGLHVSRLEGTLGAAGGEFLDREPPFATCRQRLESTRAGPCWELASSEDGGSTWRAESRRTYRREGSAPSPLEAPLALPASCDELRPPPPSAELSFLLGEWTGVESERLPDGRWRERPARLVAAELLGGAAQIDLLETRLADGSVVSRLALRGWLPGEDRWECLTLENRHARFGQADGDVADRMAIFYRRDDRGQPLLRTVWLIDPHGWLRQEEAVPAPDGLTWIAHRKLDLRRP